jgi:hypothetical protein
MCSGNKIVRDVESFYGVPVFRLRPPLVPLVPANASDVVAVSLREYQRHTIHRHSRSKRVEKS